MNTSTKGIFCLIYGILMPLFIWADEPQGIDSLQARLSLLGEGEERVEVLINLGKKIINTESELAEKYLTEAVRISEKISYPAGLGEGNLFLGYVGLKQGEREQALELFESALEIASNHTLSKLEAEIRRMLGYYWYRLGENEKATDFLLQSLRLYQDSEEKNMISRVYIQLGWVHSELGKFELSESYFKKGLEQSEKFSNKVSLIDALYATASFYINRDINMHQALSYLERALHLAREEEITYQIANILEAMGVVYQQLDKPELAKSFFKEGLELYTEIKSYSTIVSVNTTLGNLAIDEKDYDLALEYYNNSLDIIDKVDDKEYELANIYHSIGKVFQNRDKDYKKALEYFFKALENAQDGNSPAMQARIQNSIGFSYIESKAFDKALEWCKKGRLNSEELLQESINCNLCLAEAHDGLGDYKVANTYYKNWKHLSDSLYQEKLSIEVNNLEIQQRYKMELTKLEQKQAVENEKMKTQTAIIIGSISFLSLLAIMLLLISNIKKTAQKKQLLTVDSMRKELIANISHDLRTPLTVMQGYVETLLMKINSTTIEDRERYLNIILNSSERLSALIAQLFEFSKLEVKQIQPNKEPFEIKQFLQSSLAEYEVIADKQQVNLLIDCCEDAPLVYADVALIKRVIQNLLDNALKYTPQEGTISIKVSNNQNKIMIEVADTGPGISKTQQSLIFNRYQKGKDSVGAGLGLTIVKKILDLHESVINVKSELGKGTKFLFSLPVYQMN